MVRSLEHGKKKSKRRDQDASRDPLPPLAMRSRTNPRCRCARERGGPPSRPLALTLCQSAVAPSRRRRVFLCCAARGQMHPFRFLSLPVSSVYLFCLIHNIHFLLAWVVHNTQIFFVRMCLQDRDEEFILIYMILFEKQASPIFM